MSARWAATSREALSHDAPGWAQVGPLKEGEEREPFSLSAPFFGHTALTVDSASVIGTCDAYMVVLSSISSLPKRPFFFAKVVYFGKKTTVPYKGACSTHSGRGGSHHTRVRPFVRSFVRKYLLTYFVRQEHLPMLRCPGLPGFP